MSENWEVVNSQEYKMLKEERDIAIRMLAEWAVDVEDNGTGWDDWDEHYKDADFRPCLIRDLIDAARQPEKE